jgi:hypothetical protein
MKEKIINKNGKFIFVDNKGREWYPENLQDLIDLVRKLKDINETAEYYF